MNYHKIIKQDEIQASRFFAVKVESFSNLIETIKNTLWQDYQYRSVLQDLGKGKLVQDYNLDSSSQLLLLKDLVVVPNDTTIQLSILQRRHESPLAGHPGQEKTLNLVKRDLHCDRGSLFVSSFWTNLHHQLKISRYLSDAYHSENDEQKERVNQIIEQYLWIYISYHQDYWHTWLPLSELAYNRSDHSSTKQSENTSGKLSIRIALVQKDVKRELEFSINRFQRYAETGRASPPVYNPGDMVWISSKNIKSTRLTKKLSDRWLGPFPILKKVSSNAYHPKLPSQGKYIHTVFHISLFELVKTSKIPDWHQEPPLPTIIEEEKEWEVSQILDFKIKRGKLWYLLEWKGFSKDTARSTLEPTEILKKVPELVKDLHSLS
ncbi:hypothetical protein O181_087274 [Austropuccinia psidii MF-1]|uniref:Chromo domain-containing protein n=1 Tax=Austropuccinia psidii MF-1 TaxID=1389203 RepID=A0A9Q3IPE8_9BASI|nr:hypothetical protein [Austropuccinia psidii MF-1]